MSALEEEIRVQVAARQTAIQEAAMDGDDLRIAILRAEIEDLFDLARRHAAERAFHYTMSDGVDRPDE